MRAIADCAAVVTLGLAVVPMLDAGRYRGELTAAPAVRSPWRRRSGCWPSCAGWSWRPPRPPASRSAGRRAAPRRSSPTPPRPGGPALFSVAAAAGVGDRARRGRGRRRPAVVVAGLAAVGLAARTLVGHLSESASAAWRSRCTRWPRRVWCGALAALVLTVEHRGQWARVLPRFSQMSLLCVVALLAGGVIGAAGRGRTRRSQLCATGYGRVLPRRSC